MSRCSRPPGQAVNSLERKFRATVLEVAIAAVVWLHHDLSPDTHSYHGSQHGFGGFAMTPPTTEILNNCSLPMLFSLLSSGQDMLAGYHDVARMA